LQSITGQQGVAYRHIILLAEEVATQIAKNCSRPQPHSHLRPRPCEYAHIPYISRN